MGAIGSGTIRRLLASRFRRPPDFALLGALALSLQLPDLRRGVVPVVVVVPVVQADLAEESVPVEDRHARPSVAASPAHAEVLAAAAHFPQWIQKRRDG